MSLQRLHIHIHGAVQGVGFRPFVYRLATELALTGWIINDTHGVVIEVEGPQPRLDRFLERLRKEKPPLATIHALDVTRQHPAGDSSFEIRRSEGQGSKTTLILPDIATCDDCLREVFDPTNRRYRYPFTNCTNCGPRLSIIQALPYDRPHTTMNHFSMCPACQHEYDNPLDRRFHAQPNACPVCGPRLHLVGRDGLPIAPGATASGEGDAVQQAADALRRGAILAVKGIGGFHLVVDAHNTDAVVRLRQRKRRGDKPFALMVRDMAQAQEVCILSPQAEAVLASPEAPIVLLPRAAHTMVSEQVAPDITTLGIMLPSTPLHHLLLREVNVPVVATSGNLSDEPICTDNEEALHRLGTIADCFLLHNRPIARHVDDSVAWVMDGEPRLLRRARGYAPLPVLVQRRLPCILAVGAHQKNTIALSVPADGLDTPYTQVFISQHIGDLETPEAVAAFERVVADMLRLYEATPAAIAHDMHPDYHATRWAQQAQPDPVPSLIPVQHHHAHFAACLAENGVDGPALGVVWDGTGYGTDGTIWGGEFLHGGVAACRRVAHLLPFRLPGGEAAVREPRRVALALLWGLYGEAVEAVLEHDDLAPVRSFRPAERRLLVQMLERGINAPVTTSAGRLFDAIAALIGLHQQVTFEGQAAIALEAIADSSTQRAIRSRWCRRRWGGRPGCLIGGCW